MTLPDDAVRQELRDFVLGWQNIEREEFVGASAGYRPTQTAVGTTNGAGGRNVQIFVLAPDATVLHVLPGFWHPEDLVAELQLAKTLHRLWQDPTRTRAAKADMFVRLHDQHVRSQSELTAARSAWQDFDQAVEVARAAGEVRDTVAKVSDAGVTLKPLHVLVHERLQAQPFVAFADFDLERLIDYGRAFYDNNAAYDRGQPFATALRLRAERMQRQSRGRTKR